jgi:DNA-binding beta-propeller fold protein YncE
MALCLEPAAATMRLEVRVRATISVGKSPLDVALAADESELYVSLSGDNSVGVVRTADDRVSHSIPLGCTADKLAIAPDRSSVLVGCETGLRIITLPARRVDAIPTGKVADLAVTPDGKVAYLAEQRAGLWKMEISTRKISIVNPMPIAMHLALTPDGRFLYVSYQHFGPGGQAGHDAIGKFDARTGKLLRAITGLPNVGNTLAISPDSSVLWANGEDACSSIAYDHLGCPAVPAGILNIIDTATDRLLRSVPVVGTGTPEGIAFSPDGAIVAVSGRSPRFLDARTFDTLAAIPGIRTHALIFSRDGRRAYATLDKENAVAVLDIKRR